LDILPPGCSAETSGLADSVNGTSGGVFSSNGITDVFRPSCRSRSIHSIDPTVTFSSYSPIIGQSFCKVLCKGVTIHEEVTPLVLSGIAPADGDTEARPSLYSVQLVPEFWPILCQDYDPARFIIVQEVTRPSSSNEEAAVLFSAVYHFNYPAESAPQSPLTLAAPTTPSSPMFPSPTTTLWDFDSVPSPTSSLSTSDSWSFGSESDVATAARYLYADGNAYAQPHYTHNGTLDASQYPLVSPTSSCFPADLSNYLV
ncbi:hypothetical protein HWV62_33707, partial [Athelia sp. TMB]